MRVVGIGMCGLWCGLLLLAPGTAWAEPPPRAEPAAAATESSAATALPVSGSSIEAQSLALRQQANAAYLEGRYEDALPLLERANSLAPYALHAFNLAAVQHRLGRCELARDLFERYLKEDPDGPARADAERALEELFARCGRAPLGERPAASSLAAPSLAAGEEPRGGAEPAVLPLLSDTPSSIGGAAAGGSAGWPPVMSAARQSAPAVMAEPGPSALRVAGWSTLAAGGAAAIVAVASAILVRRAESDLEAMARGRERAWNADEARALQANGERYETLAFASGFGSALLLGSGVGLLLLDGRTGGVSVSTSGDGALVYSRRF